MAKNSFKAWALKEPYGELIITGVYETKTKAIDKFTVDKNRAYWRQAYKNGWRVVPVLVTEIIGREAGKDD